MATAQLGITLSSLVLGAVAGPGDEVLGYLRIKDAPGVTERAGRSRAPRRTR